MLDRQKLNPKQQAFLDDLPNMPERGVGKLHRDIMCRCNRGINAGFTADQLYEILEPMRPWRPNELESTIRKAADEAGEWQTGGTFTGGKNRKQKRVRQHKSEAAVAGDILAKDQARAAKIREALIQSVGGELDPFGPEVRAASNLPSSITAPEDGMEGVAGLESLLLFLKVAYRPDDLLYIGNKYEKGEEQRAHIKTTVNWSDFFSDWLAKIIRIPHPGTRVQLLMNLGDSYPHFCINPLLGEANSKGSFRAMDCVKEFRYVLFEADVIKLEQQIPLITALELPVTALTFSGHKSIHALTRADLLPGVGPIRDLQAWYSKIPIIFNQLAPLGFDPATKDPGRPSRLPGIPRPKGGEIQQLLFLNTIGDFHV